MGSPDAPRILIVRLSAIGDVLHGVPALNALRARWPQAFLAWMVEGRAADLLEGHPALNALVRVPRGWLKRPSTAMDAVRRLRALECDIAIDLQGLTKSSLAARLSGARRRIGFAGRDGRELSPWLNNELVEPSATHVIDRNLELLRPLGVELPALPCGLAAAVGQAPVCRPITELVENGRREPALPRDDWRQVEFNLPEFPEDALAAEEMLERLFASRVATGGPARFALINPGAGWPSKLWPVDRFAAVARWLGESQRLASVVVWSGDAERRMAESIVAGAAGRALFGPPTTLRQLAALTRRATIFVSADTGPLHLAVAVGTPAVGLFGPMPVERNGPYGPTHRGLQMATVVGGSRQRRSASNESMLAIETSDVIAACQELLAQSPGRRNCA